MSNLRRRSGASCPSWWTQQRLERHSETMKAVWDERRAKAARRPERGHHDDCLHCAWLEAKAALPDGWAFAGLYLSRSTEIWTARAYRVGEKHPFGKPSEGVVAADGWSSAQALRALTERLRERATL